ncbi:MAG: hypothetical protein R6U65_07275 [Perlabentimonas sp.]
MIDEQLLNKEEAISFLDCMKAELRRHKIAQKEAEIESITNVSDPVKHRFWKYGSKRHEEDIQMIERTIRLLETRFALC